MAFVVLLPCTHPGAAQVMCGVFGGASFLGPPPMRAVFLGIPLALLTALPLHNPPPPRLLGRRPRGPTVRAPFDSFHYFAGLFPGYLPSYVFQLKAPACMRCQGLLWLHNLKPGCSRWPAWGCVKKLYFLLPLSHALVPVVHAHALLLPSTPALPRPPAVRVRALLAKSLLCFGRRSSLPCATLC